MRINLAESSFIARNLFHATLWDNLKAANDTQLTDAGGASAEPAFGGAPGSALAFCVARKAP